MAAYTYIYFSDINTSSSSFQETKVNGSHKAEEKKEVNFLIKNIMVMLVMICHSWNWY